MYLRASHFLKCVARSYRQKVQSTGFSDHFGKWDAPVIIPNDP